MKTIHLSLSDVAAEAATLRRWLVQPSQAFRAGSVLAELDTRDALIRVTSPADGAIGEILAQPGSTLANGAPLARLGQAGDAPATPAAPSQPQASTKEKPVMECPEGVTPILMPKAGNSMEEGTIIEWKVAPGDTVSQGDIIYEVETDKASVEVEADQDGRIARIVAEAGDTIEVLKPVAFLGEADLDEQLDAYIDSLQAAETPAAPAPAEAPAAPAAPAPAAAPAAPGAPLAPAAMTDTGRVKASPAARNLAADGGVDLAAVGAGSGPGGRILSTDVPAAGAAPAAPAVAAPPVVTTGDATSQKLSPMRKAIGQALCASKQTIPHFYIEQTVDAEALMTHYRRAKAQYPCSVNDVVVAAAGRAVAEFPSFRSQINGDQLVTFPTANIGVAVGMDAGLVVPVVMAAEQLNLQQIGAETRRLAAAARGGKIENRGQGVFTISNLGMFGIDRFSAIINPPEAAILAVGTVREEVIVSGGTMRPGQVMTVTLSCDHRVIDGLEAAKFLGRLKQYLENPGLLG
jgi:pyruvate dehydrogenase E2 component (dihydrolipoamide acetyltransferase)